ncbi:MAG: hypothetical protein JW932_19615 [Deltaproteobacteria bacterium]|nr:hypothetical protein [Deltaproteobacteria bacterium]
MSDLEIHNLIFQSGFSTATKVTDVSRRGVGMDVVKKILNCEKAGWKSAPIRVGDQPSESVCRLLLPSWKA